MRVYEIVFLERKVLLYFLVSMRTKQSSLTARVNTGRMTNFPAFFLRNYAWRVKDILGTKLSLEGAPWRSDASRAVFFHNETLYNCRAASHINLVGGTWTLGLRVEKTVKFTLADNRCFFGIYITFHSKFTDFCTCVISKSNADRVFIRTIYHWN